jgi:hypothetical protein
MLSWIISHVTSNNGVNLYHRHAARTLLLTINGNFLVLTAICLRQYKYEAMVRWFTSLFMVVALAGSALAGFPMHAGEGTPGMDDCCKAARAQDDSPATLSAKLCCAVNCSEPGPTAPTGSGNISPLRINVLHSAVTQSQTFTPIFHSRFSSTQGYLQDASPPPYIRHLALLI